MKLWTVIWFEMAYQLRRASTWLFFAVVPVLAFLSLTHFVTNARGTLFNTPLAIAGATLITGMLRLLITAAVAGDAATRDLQAQITPLHYTTPLRKSTYLGGRFLGALAINILLLLLIPAGLILAVQFSGWEPEFIGPFRPVAYLQAFFYIGLPNVFFSTAILFSVAVFSRRVLASYIGALLLFLISLYVAEALAEQQNNWQQAKLLEPFGFVIIRELVHSWTPVQKDTQLIGLNGPLLWNRLLWLAVGLGTLVLMLWRFRFSHHTAGSHTFFRRKSQVPGLVPAAPFALNAPVAETKVRRTFGAATSLQQVLLIAWWSFRTIVTSWGALIPAIPAAFLILFGPELMEHLGVPILPTTGQVLRIVGNTEELLTWIAAPFLIVIYAGELVWREREARLNDISDAAPVPDWVPFLGKFLGLSLVLVLVQALLMAAGILLQVRLHYFNFEVGLYLKVLFGIHLSGYLLLAVLALFVHTVADQKYVGHLVLTLILAFTAFAASLGVEHKLLVFGSDTGWSYSDMRGFGPFVGPFLWFKFHWVAWALLFAVFTRLLWVRGRERGFKKRLRTMRSRFTRPVAWAAAAAAGLILLTGSFIFYNTNVRNHYYTTAEKAERRAAFERRYKKYEATLQPRLTGTKLHIEIYPNRREVDIKGSYRLVNQTLKAIDTLHVAPASEVWTGNIAFDKSTSSILSDEELNYRIYKLSMPLLPGEALEMKFSVRFSPEGFSNDGIDAAVAGNGTHFEGQDWLPQIGYQPDRELSQASDRRKYGLAPKPAARSLHDSTAYGYRSGAERISFEAVIGTVGDQVALAPGKLRRTWIENGRRYFHYATDAPIRNGYAIFSANYAVRQDLWQRASSDKGQPVLLQIMHHPDHALNVDRMMKSMHHSLSYLTRTLGPYPYRQLRLVEAPGPGIGLKAHPINMRYWEGVSLLNPQDDHRNIDLPFAAVAHEVAHQWWGNQLTPAEVEGAAVLAESLAWYSALGVVEETYGREHLERLLNMMRQSYLTPHASAGLPLLRATDKFDAYRKGPFAMYALREYLSEEKVNTALRRLLKTYGSGIPPLPTSLHLYQELQAVAPDTLRGLLADLFERNTYWELKTEKVQAKPNGGGNWQVALAVQARKVIVDSAGTETEIPMDDFVEIGAYAGKAAGGKAKQLYLKKHRIRSGKQIVTITVTEMPASAGIDPRNVLLDREMEDNMQAVVTEKAPAPIARGPGAGKVYLVLEPGNRLQP